MSDSAAIWEGVALSVHRGTGVDAPVDAFELADLCGLSLVPDARGGAFLRGEAVHYDGAARHVRQHGLVAHETAHHVLRLHGEDDPEQAARYTAGALMLPRADFDRDLRRTWDLRELRAKHLHCSAEMIARRVCELRDAVVTIVDNRKVRARVCSPWLVVPEFGRLTRYEREMVDATHASGEPQHAGELLAAYPFFDGPHERVVVIAELEQLSLRL